MKRGYLSEYFQGVAAKILSAVEVDELTSHQHEFNGARSLINMLGEPCGKVRFKGAFIYLTDNDDDFPTDSGFLTWYDSREKARIERKVMRWEPRLYFQSNEVSQRAQAGDLFVVAKQSDGDLLCLIAEAGTTIATQLSWLFGISDLSHPGFSVRDELETEQDRIQFASRFILESIGIPVEVSEETFLDDMLKRFEKGLPRTQVFSEYARSTLHDLEPTDHPDDVLMAWMDREEILFRTYERYELAERLSKGFANDVEQFLAFSLSVQNRRKSRAGDALENHLEAVFSSFNIRYSRGAVTENKAKPDFLFPSSDDYHNLLFPTTRLTMLGAKSTCKDRWRQVLAEADRIPAKHLLTLEAAISENQTMEMRNKNVQLIIPTPIQATYSRDQVQALMSVQDFVNLVSDRQENV